MECGAQLLLSNCIPHCTGLKNDLKSKSSLFLPKPDNWRLDMGTSQLSWTRILIGVLVSALTSWMLILAFHPFNQWYLAFIALIPMLIAQHRILPIKLSGLALGIGVGGWLLIFLTSMFAGNAGGVVIEIVVAVIIFIQLFTAPQSIQFHRQTSYRWFVLFGIVDWVGFEMVRSFIPPINTHAFIAQTMYTQPWMLQPISIFSIYGLGTLIILVNFSLTQLFMTIWDRFFMWGDPILLPSKHIRRWLWIAGGAVVIWIVTSMAILSGAQKQPDLIRIAAVQPGLLIPGHLDKPKSQPERLHILTEYTRQAAEQGAKLIVWPELGLGFDPQVDFSEEILSLAKESDAYLYIGYGLDTPLGYRNEMVLVTPDGIFIGVYGKNHPTSPGEPKIISSGVYPVNDTQIGRLATLICNDIHWTDTSRKLATNGAQIIAEPTYEIAGIALEQVAQGVLRAVENRVAIVKSDTAFASAIIDPYGKIVAFRDGSPDGAAFILVGDVPLGNPPTLFTFIGDWLGWINLAALVFFMIYQEVLKRQNKGVGAV